MQYFYEEKNDHYSYNVGAEFNDDGKLTISDWALGDIIEKTHGDSDIEHFVIISKNNVYRFIRACCDDVGHKKPKKDISEDQVIKTLNEIYKGNSKAIFDIKRVLKSNDIPYDFQVW